MNNITIRKRGQQAFIHTKENVDCSKPKSKRKSRDVRYQCFVAATRIVFFVSTWTNR